MRIKILFTAVAIGTFMAVTTFADSVDSIRAQARGDASQYYNEHKSDPGWDYNSSEVYNYSHHKAIERGFTTNGDDSLYASAFSEYLTNLSGLAPLTHPSSKPETSPQVDPIRAQARADASQYYSGHKSDPGWDYNSIEVYNYSHRRAAERGFTTHGDDSLYASAFSEYLALLSKKPLTHSSPTAEISPEPTTTKGGENGQSAKDLPAAASKPGDPESQFVGKWRVQFLGKWRLDLAKGVYDTFIFTKASDTTGSFVEDGVGLGRKGRAHTDGTWTLKNNGLIVLQVLHTNITDADPDVWAYYLEDKDSLVFLDPYNGLMMANYKRVH